MTPICTLHATEVHGMRKRPPSAPVEAPAPEPCADLALALMREACARAQLTHARAELTEARIAIAELREGTKLISAALSDADFAPGIGGNAEDQIRRMGCIIRELKTALATAVRAAAAPVAVGG